MNNAFIRIISVSLMMILLFSSKLIFSQDTTNQFLPKPSGKYQIGVTEIYLVDSSRKERFKKKDFRKIYVKIWYPAIPAETQKPELYLQNYTSELIQDIFMSKDFSFEWLNKIKKSLTNSYPNAIIDSTESTYPVIIFTPGYYFGMAELYSAYMEELTSHGYIVCSVNHPYEQPYIKLPDGEEIYIKKKRTQWAYFQLVFANWFQFRKQDTPEKIEKTTRYYHKMLHRFRKALDYWVDDAKFFVDYLYSEKRKGEVLSKVNLDQIGALGQSFGGAVTGQLCLVDERVKAGVNLDCFQFGDVIDWPLEQPFFLFQSDYQPMWNLGNTINFENIQNDFLLLSIKNASHFVFSDGAVLPYYSEDFKVKMIGKIDGVKMMKLTNDYILDFYNVYLKGNQVKYINSNVKDSTFIFQFRKGE